MRKLNTLLVPTLIFILLFLLPLNLLLLPLRVHRGIAEHDGVQRAIHDSLLSLMSLGPRITSITRNDSAENNRVRENSSVVRYQKHFPGAIHTLHDY